MLSWTLISRHDQMCQAEKRLESGGVCLTPWVVNTAGDVLFQNL